MPPVLFLLANIGFALGASATFAIAVGAVAVLATTAFVALTIAGARRPDFSSRARNHTLMLKQAVTPHRILYGKRRISGPITYMTTTEGNQFLHIVITLCAHEVEEIGTVVFDNTAIPDDFLDGDGFVTAGRYYNPIDGSWLRIQKDTGADSEDQPFPDLVTETNGDWPATALQRGHAKMYLRLRASPPFTPNGLPNISVWVKGKKVLDNRTAATHWNPNPAVCIEDYIRTTSVNSGLGGAAADIDTTTLDSTANTCDEFVTTLATEHTVDADHDEWPGVDTTNDLVLFSGDSDENFFLRFQPGDKVQVFDPTGVLPTGIAEGVDYYVQVYREMRSFQPERIAGSTSQQLAETTHPTGIRFSTSYTNALKTPSASTYIALSGSPTGTFVVRKLAEPRYTCNYLIDVDREPQEILTEMASSMNPIGGGVSRVGGSWFFKAAVWVASVLTLDEDDTIGKIDVQTKSSRKDRVNTVSGLYVNPFNFEQPTNYQTVKNSTYVTEDGETHSLDVDFPASSREAATQRLAKIVLEDARQSITCRTTFSLAAMQLIPGDVFTYDNSRFGWSGKTFRVTDWSLATQDSPTGPVDVVEVAFKETASGIYDWADGDETVIDLAVNSDLPNAFEIAQPDSIQVVESIIVPAGIKAISVATVSWDASLYGFVDKYEVEYKLNADSTYTFHTSTTALTTDILDLPQGLYDFRVRAVTTIGIPSPWTDHTQELFSLSARPGDVTGLSVIVTEGLATLTWTQATDVDVLAGGTVEIRHDSDTSTPDWANSVGIGSGGVPGSATQATVPLRDGHLLVKFVDTKGNKSVNEATVKVLQDSVHGWATLDTATEETAFSGAKTQMVVTASKLTLDLDGADVFSTGDYTFNANSVDLGSVLNVRVTPTITVVTSFINDTVDDRSGNVDDWPNWDGVEGSECDARNEMRTTTDDPTGAPTWTAWELLDANTVTAWGLQYRTQVTSTDDEANIEISTLQVKVEERLAL